VNGFRIVCKKGEIHEVTPYVIFNKINNERAQMTISNAKYNGEV